jgi:hypothetical protein
LVESIFEFCFFRVFAALLQEVITIFGQEFRRFAESNKKINNNNNNYNNNNYNNNNKKITIFGQEFRRFAESNT